MRSRAATPASSTSSRRASRSSTSARAQGVAAFAGLPPGARLAALQAIGAAHPAFVPALVFHTYAGYYQEPRVVAALGVASHPPFPKGFALAPFDESRLAQVKQRAKLYRDA